MPGLESSTEELVRLVNGYQVSQAVHVAAALGLADELADGGHLLHRVRTGENAFRAVHGVDVWRYRAQRPEEAASFDAAMSGSSRRIDDAVAAAHDFGRYRVIVDVGGGRGALLAGILARHPGVRGILFDQPAVVAHADVDGAEIVGGDFFASVPPGGDAYLLKYVLHDWEDDAALRILRACRRAAGPGTALLVIEREPSLPATLLSDLNMLVGPGGRERTVAEYAALLASAGYELLGQTPTAIGVSVFEARAI